MFPAGPAVRWRSLCHMRPLLRVRRASPSRAPLVALLLSVVLLGGCTSEASAPRRTGPTAVPLEQVDLSGVSAVWAPFCEALDETSTTAALGGKPQRSSAYGPGDRVALTPDIRDVAHEYGCVFRRGGMTARAWLFAQPVTRGQARSYVAERHRVPGCSTAGVLEFGSPGVVQTCRPARLAGAAVGGAAPGTS